MRRDLLGLAQPWPGPPRRHLALGFLPAGRRTLSASNERLNLNLAPSSIRPAALLAIADRAAPVAVERVLCLAGACQQLANGLLMEGAPTGRPKSNLI